MGIMGTLPTIPKKHQESVLETFFKEVDWEYDWDFKSSTEEYWFEVMLDNDIVFQVDMDTPVETMLKDLREFVPQLGDAEITKNSLPVIAKKLKGKHLYISPDEE